MAYIKVIHPDQAEGKLAEIFQRVRGPGGQVDNVLQIHSLRPHTLEGHMALYKAVLHHPGNQVPKWFLECIGVLVSLLNECSYCVRHHSLGLQRLLKSDPDRHEAYMEALNSEQPGSPFSPAEAAALAYVRTLTLAPGAIEQQNVNALRQAGFSDGQILEINQVAGYFAYANRTVAGLGVNTEGEQPGLSPDSTEQLEDWSHP